LGTSSSIFPLGAITAIEELKGIATSNPEVAFDPYYRADEAGRNTSRLLSHAVSRARIGARLDPHDEREIVTVEAWQIDEVIRRLCPGFWPFC
jgi:hypothetical protein